MSRLALSCGSGAEVRAEVQVVVGRDALAQIGGSRSQVGKGRVGPRAGFGRAATHWLVFALHVILQTPQIS